MNKSNKVEILIYGIFFVFLAGYIVNIITIKKYNDLKIEKARMEQQIIDYRWQLEQLQYTCNAFVGE